MPSCSTANLFFTLWVSLFLGAGLAVQQFPSFGFQRFDKGSNFESQISLFGDARVSNKGAVLQLTEPRKWSAGRVMHKEPIKLGNRQNSVSFGTYFTFSLSQESGEGLVFLMAPGGGGLKKGYPGLSHELSRRKIGAFGVEFDTKMDARYGDVNGNHVGIDVNSFVSVKVANASKSKMMLNSGERMHCWIDYEASSKHVEVRLSKFGEMRPISPLMSCRIDLAEYFKNKEVWFGLSSANSNSSQVCKVYSWSFSLRPVPYWMHSQPLDPNAFSKDAQPAATMHKRSDCVLRVLTAIMVGTGCGALGATIVLFLWTFFTAREQVMPEEFVSPRVEYDCDKVKVIVVDQPLKECSKQ